ncbi:hypothetical protein, partial [Cronobacter sakazakii]|uniref:hypothetical protein n=1 Tax=Cronobacter sakazakii TaxID=28141 RepID=UPI001F43D98E
GLEQLAAGVGQHLRRHRRAVTQVRRQAVFKGVKQRGATAEMIGSRRGSVAKTLTSNAFWIKKAK